MKKHFLSYLTILSFLIVSNSYSQLPNQNMYLLKNLNQHPPTSSQYSAIWGYVAPDNREYAILGCNTGTAFIDITDSANIHEVDYLTGQSSSWREMKTYSHYCYIVSESDTSKMQIVDLQYLPDSVHLVKKYTTTNYRRTHSISQSGPYLFLNGANTSFVSNGGIAILDLSADPENPVLRGKWTTMYVHDCRVVNDTIYAANISDERVTIISATNKDAPTTVTSFVNLPGSGPHNTALTDDRKRLFVTDEIGTVTPHVLKVWNIENLSNITYVTNWQPTGITQSIVHNIEIYGDLAIVAHYSAGIRVLNIANPDAPQEIAWYDTYPSNNSENYSGCWGVYMFPSGKIAASDRSTGFYCVKVGTPTSIQQNSVIIPQKYLLQQNYPNPFNPSTTIKFSLSENSMVSLKIYDAIGSQVAELINGKKNEGDHEINFDADKYGLTSGSYFYTLRVNDLEETKRMLLVK